MTEVQVINPHLARPGNEEAVGSALRRIVAKVRLEPGCGFVHIFRSPIEAGQYVIHSGWSDEAVVDSVMRRPYVGEALDRLAPITSHPFKATIARKLGSPAAPRPLPNDQISTGLHLFARFVARPGNHDALEAALLDAAATTRGDPGCLSLDVLRSTREESLFAVHSHWAGRDDLDRHFRRPHTIEFLQAIGELTQTQLDIHEMLRLE